MNDFTREELENILNGNVELYPHTYQELRNKIQSMIENYCEHEWHNHCSECNPLNIYCKECRVYLREIGKVDSERCSNFEDAQTKF